MQRDLKAALAEAGATQVDLADHLGVSKATVCNITKGRFPKRRAGELMDEINRYLIDRNVPVAGIWCNARPDNEDGQDDKEACIMLTQAARNHFGLLRDPFTADVTDGRDVYLTDNSRYVSEYMYLTAKTGGMLAVVGESGSGKSTLRRQLLDRISSEELKIKVIFPRTIDKGRLTAAAICDAIIADCSEERIKRGLEAKSRQIEKVLTASSRAGWSHVLMIEEAHDLDVRTLKYLKRFWELEDGFRKLLSVILVAQPELKAKLDESRNWEAREIIRRMEVAEIQPFTRTEELAEYVALKFTRLGVKADKALAPDAYPAILEKMVRKTRNGYKVNYCYPLSVNNLVKQALNTAAQIGAPLVDAEIIKSL